jgi:hypothetical protein
VLGASLGLAIRKSLVGSFEAREVQKKPYRLYDGVVVLKRGLQRCPTRRHRRRPPIRARVVPRGQARPTGAPDIPGRPGVVAGRLGPEIAGSTRVAPTPVATKASGKTANVFIWRRL